MNDARTILAAAVLFAASHQPLGAQQNTAAVTGPQPQGSAVQVADASAPGNRNITAAVGRPRQTAKRAGAENVHPSGAQALMVLGIALIVTPAMFRGAFSN
mgnify:FL=1